MHSNSWPLWRGTVLCQTWLTRHRTSLIAGGCSADHARRKCVPRTNAHRTVVSSAFAGGTPGPWRSGATTEREYPRTRAHTPQGSSLLWQRDQHIQSEASGKYPAAGCDQLVHMSRCNLGKDVRQILFRTRFFNIITRTAHSFTTHSPADDVHLPVCAFSYNSAPRGTHRTPSPTQSYY